MSAPIIRPATAADIKELKRLLGGYGLPRADLGRYTEGFLVAEGEGGVAGCAGLELYGSSTILRSVAVAERWRGSGLGRRLTEEAIELARRKGVKRLYLFTAGAEGFFSRFGFRAVHIDEMDEAAQKSREYQLVRRLWPRSEIKVMLRELS
jgi:amino-acid N-acetyltransferase